MDRHESYGVDVFIFSIILLNFAHSINEKYIIMNSRTSKWFETSVRYERQMDDSSQKKITELYVVEALSFSEAELMITQVMSSYVSGEFEVKNITPAAYSEIFFSENANDDRWYKARLSFITIDEKTEKEKRSSVTYLVQASTFNAAVKNIEDVMSGTLIDYVISNITETKIMDVYTHDEIVKPKTADDKPEYEQ